MDETKSQSGLHYPKNEESDFMEQQQVTLTFMDGEEVEALAAPFVPSENKIEVMLAGTDIRLCYSLKELVCIHFHKGKNIGELPPAKLDSMEEIETLSGAHYQVYVPPKQNMRYGFLAMPVDVGGPWRQIFFCPQGIKDRKNKKFLGDILEAKGLVSPEDMQSVLEQQQKLRTRRIGEIIAEKNHIPQETIDNTVVSLTERNRALSKARIGDILVAAGLVTRQQVEEAIASQRAGKKNASENCSSNGA
ncbi:MAG: hypothetical protein P8X63_03950 [Desulfuromonadaceae bacterium]